MENSVYLWMAIVGTVVFLFKLVSLMFFGDGADVDTHASSFEGSDSFDLISVQSIMTFLMSFGWLALSLTEEFGWDTKQTVITSTVFGILVTYLFALGLYKLKKLSSPSLTEIVIPEGTVCEVYSNIPSKGTGEVKVYHQGQVRYLPAKSEDGTELKTSTSVVVTKSNPLTVKENK